MKFTIEYEGIKRQIDGPFNLCASKEDLAAIADAIREFDEKAVYGWIFVRQRRAKMTPNQTPLGWKDRADTMSQRVSSMDPPAAMPNLMPP